MPLTSTNHVVTLAEAVEAIKITKTRIRGQAFAKTQEAIQNWDGESYLRIDYTALEHQHAIDAITKAYTKEGWTVSTNYSASFQLVFSLPFGLKK